MRKTKRKDMVTEEDIRPESAKIRITMYVPIALQAAYKKEAHKLGIGYQTLMQMKLKDGLESSLEKRVTELEKKLGSKAS